MKGWSRHRLFRLPRSDYGSAAEVACSRLDQESSQFISNKALSQTNGEMAAI